MQQLEERVRRVNEDKALDGKIVAVPFDLKHVRAFDRVPWEFDLYSAPVLNEEDARRRTLNQSTGQDPKDGTSVLRHHAIGRA